LNDDKEFSVLAGMSKLILPKAVHYFLNLALLNRELALPHSP
jgi:hypothetical protein